MTIDADLRKLHQTSQLLELYDLDATNIGGSVYHLSPQWVTGGFFDFNGITYTCFPISSSGWELSSTGTAPRPTLQVSNVTQVWLSAITSLGDLTGMKVRRFRVFAKNLDGQPDADPTAISRPEVYYVEQKLEESKTRITWQLASPADRASVVLPARQYLKDDITGNVYAPGLARYRGA